MEKYINLVEYNHFKKEMNNILISQTTEAEQPTELTNKDLKLMLQQLYKIMSPYLSLFGLYNPCFQVYDDTLLNNTTKYWGVKLSNKKVTEKEFFAIYNKGKSRDKKNYLLCEIVDTEWLFIPLLNIILKKKYNVDSIIEEVKYKTYSLIPVLEISKTKKVGMTVMNDSKGFRTSLLLKMKDKKIDVIKLYCDDLDSKNKDVIYNLDYTCGSSSEVDPIMQLYLFYMSVPTNLKQSFIKKINECFKITI